MKPVEPIDPDRGGYSEGVGYALWCASFLSLAGLHRIYLGKKREARAKAYSANDKKLLAIVEEMTVLNMKLLKEDACLGWPT